MIDWKAIKSAEVVNAEELTTREAAPGTSVSRDHEGHVVVSKEIGLADPSGVPPLAELKALAAKANLPWVDAYAERAVPYWASDERVDRHGDIVEQSWQFKEFDDNPVMLYSHDWEMPPIGNVIKHEVTKRKDGAWEGDALHLLGVFATAEQWEWADTVFRLTKANILRKGSVGFFPGEVVKVKDPEERAKLGIGEYGYILRNNRLFEWSPTSIPAHPKAGQVLSAARAKGLVKAGDVQVVRELVRREMLAAKSDTRKWRIEDARLLMLWQSDQVVGKDIDIPIIAQAGTEEKPTAATLEDVMKAVTDLTVEVNSLVTISEDTRRLVEEGSLEPKEVIEPKRASVAARALELLASRK